MKPDPRPHNILLGVILIIAAAFTISVQDIVFKLFSNTLSVWQIFAVRSLLAFPLLIALMLVRKDGVAFLGFLQKWPLLRGTFLTVTFMAYYSAIAFISLSAAGAANYTAPIFVALISAYVMREPVGRCRWVAVFVGFGGVVALLRPGADAFSFWTMLPLIGAVFYALGHITTRLKCRSVPVTTLALSLNMMMLIAGLGMSAALMIWPPDPALVAAYPNVFAPWSTISSNGWLVLSGLAVLTVVIGMLLAGAYQAAPPATIATFEYTYLVFVVLWDMTFFATTPNEATLLGMALVISAGLIVIRR